MGRACAGFACSGTGTRSVALLGPELGAERIVPVVGDLADRLEQVLELFVVQPGKASQGADDDLVAVCVDGKRRV